MRSVKNAVHALHFDKYNVKYTIHYVYIICKVCFALSLRKIILFQNLPEMCYIESIFACANSFLTL